MSESERERPSAWTHVFDLPLFHPAQITILPSISIAMSFTTSTNPCPILLSFPFQTNSLFVFVIFSFSLVSFVTPVS